MASPLTSTSMWLGMSAGRHSISTSRSTWSRMPPSVLTPTGIPSSLTRTLTRRTLSSAMRFMSMWISLSLMGSRCQSTIMALAAGDASDLDIEDGVVAGLGEEDPRDLLGIDFNGDGIMTCSIEDSRNLSGDTHAARGIFIELALTGLGYDDFRHSNLSFLYSGTGALKCRSLCAVPVGS